MVLSVRVRGEWKDEQAEHSLIFSLTPASESASFSQSRPSQSNLDTLHLYIPYHANLHASAAVSGAVAACEVALL